MVNYISTFKGSEIDATLAVVPVIQADLVDLEERVTAGTAAIRGVKHVSSISALRLLAGQYDGQVIELTSRVAGGLYGGGFHAWRSSATNADDDIRWFAVSGVSIGRWERLKSQIVDAGTFGSVTGEAIFYVSTTGASTNVGINALQPARDVQDVIDYIKSLGRVFNGDLTINVAAGVYDKAIVLNQTLFVDGLVKIKGADVGGHPNIPTTVIDGTELSLGNAITISRQTLVELQDIKTQNITGAGVRGEFCTLIKRNIHCSEGLQGWYHTNRVSYTAYGGILENNTNGVHELFNIVRNFDVVASIEEGTVIRNNTRGFFAKEHCTGHLDFANITDNDIGIVMSRSCTANASDAVVKRNRIGAFLQNGSYMVPNGIDWGIGTEDENTENNWVFVNESGFLPVGTGEVTLPSEVTGFTERQMGNKTGTYSHTGTTDEVILTTCGVHKGGGMLYAGQYLRLSLLGFRTGSAAVATLRVELQGSNFVNVPIPTDALSFNCEIDIIAAGPSNQNCFAVLTCSGSSTPSSIIRQSRTVDFSAFSADRDIQVAVQLGNSSDTVTLVKAVSYTNYQ